MTSLWHDTVRSMWEGRIEDGTLDYVAGIDTILYTNLLQAESMDYEFDLGRDLWLNRVRWTNLIRMYLDLSEVTRFIQRSADIGLGEGKRGVVTSMFCRNVARAAKKHRWGNCMAAFTYRGLRTGRPTIGLHSRVSYIAYIGGADLAVAHTLARYIGKRIKVPVEEFSFEWYIDALQFHGFKSLPMLYKQEYIKDLENKELRQTYPTQKIVGKWWDQMVDHVESGRTLDEIKYGPLRRVTRRYMEYINDEFMPSVPVATLNFEKLVRR